MYIVNIKAFSKIQCINPTFQRRICIVKRNLLQMALKIYSQTNE